MAKYRIYFLEEAKMEIKAANVMARIEPEIKEQAEKIIREKGYIPSQVINAFYRKVIEANGIPFPLVLPMNKETQKAKKK